MFAFARDPPNVLHYASCKKLVHSNREDVGLRPFFAIYYLRELKVCLWVSHVKKMH